jgi:hypothetical protein
MSMLETSFGRGWPTRAIRVAQFLDLLDLLVVVGFYSLLQCWPPLRRLTYLTVKHIMYIYLDRSKIRLLLDFTSQSHYAPSQSCGMSFPLFSVRF